MKNTETQEGQTVPLHSLVGYPMLLGKAMEPHFVVAENIKDAIDVVESQGWEQWEFQHSNSYLILANEKRELTEKEQSNEMC